MKGREDGGVYLFRDAPPAPGRQAAEGVEVGGGNAAVREVQRWAGQAVGCGHGAAGGPFRVRHGGQGAGLRRSQEDAVKSRRDVRGIPERGGKDLL